MTESQLRSKVANWLVPYIGIKESSTQHLEILKVFNDSKLCSRYKMTAKDAWCATGASASFIGSGLAGAAGSGALFECVECSCGYMITAAQKQGIWIEADDHVPQIGDLVLYDWQDSGSGDNTNWPDHVGIVISVNGINFKVIEANYNNTVAYRNMVVNGRYIRGFIAPNYAKFATPEVAVTPAVSQTNSTPAPNKTCKFIGVVTAKSALNVRSWAGTAGTKVLRTLKKGTVVEVCDTIKDNDGDDWYYIKENGKYGFVYCDYVARQENTPTKANSSTPNKTCKYRGIVTASALKVRSWAGTNYKNLRTLKKGTIVEVCDELKATTGKPWYYIKQDGKYGFVSAEYISRI